MITEPKWLYLAYVFNIFILVPVCYAMFTGNGIATVFENKVPASDGLVLLVGSLWLAILIASVCGLLWPALFAPIVLVQIIYKSVWLIAFIMPLLMAGKPYPAGISASFLIIVLGYPLLLWLATRGA